MDLRRSYTYANRWTAKVSRNSKIFTKIFKEVRADRIRWRSGIRAFAGVGWSTLTTD